MRPLAIRWHGRSSAQLVELAALAVATRYWPLYEVEQGQYRITHLVCQVAPVRAWLEKQGRFRHLLNNGAAITAMQTWTDENWKRLESRVNATKG